MSKSKIKYIKRALNIVWRSSPKWTFINAFVILLKGFLPILLIYVIKILVDEISTAIGNNQYQVENLYYALGFTGVIFILNGILATIASLVSEKHSYYIQDYIQNIIHNRTATLDYGNYEDINFQNIFYRAINESSYRPSRIYYGFIRIIQNGITLALIAGILSALHWSLVIILLFISLPIVYIRLNYSKRLFNLKKEQTEQERVVNYHQRLLTGKEFAKELRIFNLSHLFKDRYEVLKNSLRINQYNILKKKTYREIYMQVFAALSLFVVFGYVTKGALNGTMSQGTMVMYLLALHRGYGFLQELLSSIASLFEDGLFLKNLFEFIDFKTIDSKIVKKSKFPAILRDGISVNNLGFRYPNSKRMVFEDLNLNINKGETVALVGANGAGKTTLIKLICGLYNPTEGSVKADNIDISTITNESLSQNISVIFQDFMLYNTSAKENIWFGDITKGKDNNEIVNSAKKAGIHSTLDKLDDGYETTLGTLFKDSEMLSTGEWQRMALSRSFFNNGQLIILDEPTSSMDAFTEAQLIENFNEIVNNRTAIIVSHRLSTIKLADRVLVLNDHKLEEQGTPRELMQKKGLFYKMVMATKQDIK